MPQGTHECCACWGRWHKARMVSGAQYGLSLLYQEMLSKARAGDTGVKLEVNER